MVFIPDYRGNPGFSFCKVGLYTTLIEAVFLVRYSASISMDGEEFKKPD